VVALSKKVCLLGDFAVGKTSLVRRFIYNVFDDKYLSTMGVKVSRKVIVMPSGNDVRELTMMLWDLAGGNEFGDVRTSYLRGAAGGILVCDLTRQATLVGLSAFARDLRQASRDARIIIAANKADLTTQQRLSEDDVRLVAARIGAPYFLTSAKLGNLVEDMFRHMGQLLVE
jgi:small GTP-binding protein